MPKPKAIAEDKKWMAEGDLSTLIEAQKIKCDAARLKAALACRDERLKALKDVGTKGGKE